MLSIKYTESCTVCHGGKKDGEIAGYFKPVYMYSELLEHEKYKLLLYFIMLSPLPLLSAFIVSHFISRKINALKNVFIEEFKEINSVNELSKIERIKPDVFFNELEDVFSQVNQFIIKVKNIATDKDVLEFQIKIMERLLITSEVIDDWRKYVLNILEDFNKIIPLNVVFCFFRNGENEYSAEFFWLIKPSDNFMKKMEEQLISDYSAFFPEIDKTGHIFSKHVVSSKAKNEEHIDAVENISFVTKSLMIDKPKVGGIFGIGIKAEEKNDSVKLLAFEGVLTAMLNVVGSVKAISHYNRELEYYSTRDHITALFNQRVFHELLGYEIARACRQNQTFCLIIIDMDNFKYINDTYGYEIGDRLLRKISDIIKDSVRLGDIIARYSGDEFTLIMPNSDISVGIATVKRIISKIEKYQFDAEDGQIIRLTASAGIAVYPEHGRNSKELFSFADTMLYKAKREGKNKILMPDEKDVDYVKNVIALKVQQINKALEENRIIPYFQPIMDTTDKEINMYEVLCRIDLGDKIVSAYEFIEIAERVGSILKIDYLMLENTFKMLENEDITLFINLSPKSLVISEYIDNLISLTRKYNINPENIVLELTERETVKNLKILEKFVLNLKAEGFKFAIDDFGSGFSSYDYIKRFPVDFVKIEGDFIKNMLFNTKDLAIVRSLLILTEEFGIKTIAEFIETEEIAEKVAELKIDYMQGYFIGKPLPVIEKINRCNW
jgi:diguanylate cyclase (GGDEF)-like protein